MGRHLGTDLTNSFPSFFLGSNDGNAACDDFLLTDRRTFVVLATPNDIVYG
jgi:hypothetical protein